MSSFLKQIGNIIFPSLKTDLPVHPYHSIVFSQGRERILTALLRASVALGLFALLNNLLLAVILQEANYETEIIQDGQSASQRLAVVIPDIVILDLHLPFVSGVDILKQIRADEHLARTQVIIITADMFRVEAL